MQRRFGVFVVALLLHVPIAAGDDLQCKAVYRGALRDCARSLDLLASDARGGAQKACVDGAQITRAYCASGVNACLDRCTVTYEKSVVACEATFATAVCRGGETCESIVLQQRDNCISHTVSVLDACSAACP